jgi:hypothetical protein
MLALGIIIPIIIGCAFVHAVHRGGGLLSDRSQVVNCFFMGTGTGIGITSLLYFLWLQFLGAPGTSYIIAEVLVALCLIGFSVRAVVQAKNSRTPPGKKNSDPGSRFYWVISTGFWGLLALSILGFLFASLNTPHGDWDAWAMWNLKARFLFLGGDQWRNLFTVNSGLHLDYPLLLPGFIARCWTYVGDDPVVVPAVVAAVFTFSTVGLICSALAVLRGKSQGFLAGIMLLCNPTFLREGAKQYADVPLSYYILLATVLVILHGRENKKSFLALAGLAAGLAAWTKNEGVLFLAAFAVAHFATTIYTQGIRNYFPQLMKLSYGLFPVLAVLLFFKWWYAPPSDVVLAEGVGPALEKVFQASRHIVIIKYIMVYFILFGGLLLIFYWGLSGLKMEKAEKSAIIFSIIILSIMMAGYYFIYLTTAYPLDWHLGTSLRRILLQLWPLFIFTFFLAAPSWELIMIQEPSATVEKQGKS